MIRPLASGAVLLAVAGCASSAAPVLTFNTTATPKDAVACLSTALDSAGYNVVRTDRRKGFVQATKVQDSVNTTANDFREYRRLDVLTFESRKPGAWTAKVVGERHFVTNVGNQQEPVDPRPVANQDAAALVKRCSS